MKKSSFCIVFLLLAFASQAWAVAEVKDPLSRIYKVDSASVYSATIVKFNPDDKVIEAKLARTYKGEAPSGSIKILIKDNAALTDELKAAKDQGAGMTIVLFPSARTVLAHIADHWYGGLCGSRPGAYIINERKTDQDGTFPGTTATLLTALDELKAGKSTLVDVFPPITLPKPEKITDLPAQPVAFAALILPNQKTPTFFVSSSSGLKALLLKEDHSLQDNTVELGLDNLKPTLLAVVISDAGTTRATPALATDDHFYALSHGKFEKSNGLGVESGMFAKNNILGLAPDKILAAVFESPDDHKDSMNYVTSHGLVRIFLETPALAHPEDDLRLTGSKLTSYYPAHKSGFTAASIVSIDINNDGRPDLIILTPEGTLTLLNRGFGCYLVNKNIAAPLLEPITPPSTTQNSGLRTQDSTLPLLAATAHTLYRLDPDGTLYRYDFPSK